MLDNTFGALVHSVLHIYIYILVRIINTLHYYSVQLLQKKTIEIFGMTDIYYHVVAE